MTHAATVLDTDPRTGVVVARGCGWGAVAGAVSGALFIAPVVAWNGPLVALLVYPPLAAVPGAAVGALVGTLTALGLLATRPVTTAGARTIAAFTGALCLAWIPLAFGVPLAALWLLVLSSASGALFGPRVSARRNGAAAATGTTFPGSSRAPGR